MGSRFKIIGILTVLAVLASLLSIVPIRAQTAGTITLTGGVTVGADVFFSDRTGFNVVTATITDADLSTVRTGRARFINVTGGTTTFDIDAATTIVEGEKSVTKTFNGVQYATGETDNGETLQTGTADNATASTTVLVDNQADFVAAGVDAGDIVTNTTDGNATCTVATVDSATQVTCAAPLSGAQDFDSNDNYTITAQAASTTVLKDAAANFTGISGLAAGDVVINTTDNARCAIASFTKTTVTCAAALTGGANFDGDDNYQILDATFDLAPTDAVIDLPRDADADGVYEDRDVVVTVSGNEYDDVAAAEQYTVTFSNGALVFGIEAVPSQGTGNIVATYEVSEFGSPTLNDTPLQLAGTQVFFGEAGGAAPFDWNAVTNEVLAVGVTVSTGVVTVSSTPAVGANNEVLVVFKYNVKEQLTEFASFSTPSLGAKGLTRSLTATETTASSSVFVAKAGLFSTADFDKISQATTDTNTVDNVEAAAGITGTELATRIDAAATALGITQNAAGSARQFLNLLVPVADGEVLTVSYLDQSPSPATTRTAVANIDLRAPTIRIVQPADNTYSNSLAQSFVVEVTDDPSAGGKKAGLNQGDVSTLVIRRVTTNITQSNAVSPLLIGTDSFRINFSFTFAAADEGEIQWWVPTKDRVGNVPDFTGSDAILGAGDPGNATTVPGNPSSVFLDLAAPAPASAGAGRPVVTGGKQDTRFAVPPTGVHTAGNNTTTLTDSNANFVSLGVLAGDKLVNTSEGASCTVQTVTTTTLTCAAPLAGGTGDNTWNTGEAYRIENPKLNTVTWSNTDTAATAARRNVVIFFTLGNGKAPLNPDSVQPTDFTVAGANPASVLVGAVDTANNEQGVLLTLAADQLTSAKPAVEITGSVLDMAGNAVATRTGSNALTALDGLAPSVSVTITGQAASRPVSNTTITIDLTSGEAAAGTPQVQVHRLGAAVDNTLGVAATTTLGVVSTGVNSWRSTMTFDGNEGLRSVVITITDAAGNPGTVGVADPDGSGPAGTMKAEALLFEFDSKLNGGTTLSKLAIGATSGSGFVLSPNTGTQNDPATDLTSPFVTIHFDGEASEYPILADLDGDTQVDDPIPNVDTHKAVTLTSAIWTMPDGTQVNILSQMQKVDDNSFVYAATNLPLGTHKIAIQARDVVGNVSTIAGSTTPTTFTYEFKVVERGKYKLTLQPGTNFVSLPGTPANPSINAVIPANAPINLVATYDPTSTSPWLIATRNPQTGLFEGTLSSITAEHGYVVQATSFYTLEVLIPRAGFQQLPPSIPVFGGEWNLVPVVSAKDATDPAVQPGQTVDSDVYFGGLSVAAVFTFDTAQAQFVKVVPDGSKTDVVTTDDLVFGRSYWVRPVNDGTIIP